MADECIDDGTVHQVLRRFPALGTRGFRPLGNHGGFSGARLWRFEGEAQAYCLRAWPAGVARPYVLWVHRFLRNAADAGLDFVPRVVLDQTGQTVVSLGGRCWEVETWLPGAADFAANPSAARIEAACTALGRLHLVWAAESEAPGPCPALARRLDKARKWLELSARGWRPAPAADDPVGPLAVRLWPLLCERIPPLPGQLLPWQQLALPLQPCLCDPWHDHVLFRGNIVTGLVDFGSVKVDHVSVDLARLLGSLAGNDSTLWNAGLDAYRRVRSLAPQEERLIGVLDESGVLLGAASWLRWLYHEKRHYVDREAVACRLRALVARLE